MKATAEKLTRPGMPKKAGNRATVRTAETKGTPAAAEMPATSGTHSLSGVHATAMTQVITATPRAAEILETVLMPITREFLQKFGKIWQKSEIL
jgi:hypothetical protein